MVTFQELTGTAPGSGDETLPPPGRFRHAATLPNLDSSFCLKFMIYRSYVKEALQTRLTPGTHTFLNQTQRRVPGNVGFCGRRRFLQRLCASLQVERWKASRG